MAKIDTTRKNNQSQNLHKSYCDKDAFCASCVNISEAVKRTNLPRELEAYTTIYQRYSMRGFGAGRNVAADLPPSIKGNR